MCILRTHVYLIENFKKTFEAKVVTFEAPPRCREAVPRNVVKMAEGHLNVRLTGRRVRGVGIYLLFLIFLVVFREKILVQINYSPYP